MPEPISLPPSLTKWTGFVLAQVANLGEAVYEQAISSLGITGPHLSVLMVLEHNGPSVQAHLSVPLQIDKATMVGLINLLEEKGLVKRKPHPKDRRAFLIHITQKGRNTVTKAAAINKSISKDFFGALSSQEQKLFHDFLLRTVSHVENLLVQKK